MKRVVVTAPGEHAVVDVTPVDPGPGEVRLRLISAGICGGDLSLLAGRNAVARYPTGLGHECVAQVDAAGDGTDLVPGDHVVVYPTIGCGRCRACAEGRDNQCPEMRVMGLSDANGCFADTFTASVRQCVPVPAEIATAYGALIEPIAVAWHVTGRAGVEDGASALVLGAGVIGMATAVVAKVRGAGAIRCADRFASRAAAADALGLGEVSTLTGDALAAYVTETDGPVDLVFDTVTTTETAAVALQVLRPGGRYIAIASAKPGHEVSLRYDLFYAKELSVVGCRNYTRDDFASAVALLAEGRVDPRPLRTASHPLDDFDLAVADLRDRPERNLKVMLTPSREAR